MALRKSEPIPIEDKRLEGLLFLVNELLCTIKNEMLLQIQRAFI